MATATIIDGVSLASTVKEDLSRRVEAIDGRVSLDAVLVGEDQGAKLYAKNQAKACAKVGIEYTLHQLPASASHAQVEKLIVSLNEDPAVTAIMVQMPLPDEVRTDVIQSLIAPHKDVEGVNPANIGNIVFGRRSLVPCTALAVMEMIESTGIDLKGARAVCVGASTIVGKPVAVLLMQAEATVISTNVYTKDHDEIGRAHV